MPQESSGASLFSSCFLGQREAVDACSRSHATRPTDFGRGTTFPFRNGEREREFQFPKEGEEVQEVARGDMEGKTTTLAINYVGGGGRLSCLTREAFAMEAARHLSQLITVDLC